MEYTGIYLGYFSGEFGNSMGVFLVQVGRITGGDIGAGIYDGEFKVVNGFAVGKMNFRTKTGGQTITGAINDLPISYDTDISLELPLEKPDFHSVQTLNGPVNVRFEKVRSI
ncbi:hypothetical protein N8306_04420 [Yoonia sp.]|nr:hypothetical protein [Yoonia sp.]